mgnify:CR=1 FL=1
MYTRMGLEGQRTRVNQVFHCIFPAFSSLIEIKRQFADNTSSNQRLGSALYWVFSVIMEKWVV